MFAGIGGFRSGLEATGGFECVGYCEINRHAKQAYEALYQTEGELYYEGYPISTFFSQDFHARAFHNLEAEKDLKILVEKCFSKLQGLLPLKDLAFSSSKMFPDCLTMTKGKHLKLSSVHWIS